MGAIEPNSEQIGALLASDPGDSAVVMLNLLRFREQAEYPADFVAEPCDGREAYHRYAEHALAALAKVGGHIKWAGPALATVIAPDGETWDEVALVEYPSKEAFLELGAAVGSNQATVHRTAGLADSRLIAVIEGDSMPGATKG